MDQRTFYIRLEPLKYVTPVQLMLSILLPDYSFHFPAEGEECGEQVLLASIINADYARREPLVTEVKLCQKGRTVLTDVRSHEEILDPRYTEDDYERRGKDLIKTHIYTFLANYLGEEVSPWGILTGVRPTKLLHYLRDSGFSFTEIEGIFREVYAISTEKTDLMLRIGRVEEMYLPDRVGAKKRISLYVGIPFCPSRCNYCSFPAFSLQKHGRFIGPFLETLYHEIEVTGRFIKEHGLEVDSIYLGGGTPTSLSTTQMEGLLRQLAKHLSFEHLVEYNVEAGRPDTLSPEKLKVLFDNGVRRISVNPQTMQQHTLDAIGRHHTVDQIKQVFYWAKEAGFPNINMDLIVGLPGETLSDVQSTIAQVLEMQPDSVTVHTLALKKAAVWWETAGDLPFPGDEEVSRMLEYIAETLKGHQLLPYYMYRQKYILGNQENVGYAFPGKESLYNMIMIDERESVIGLGGGAITKAVNPEDWSLVRYSNPKYPGDYINDIERILSDKLSLLTSIER